MAYARSLLSRLAGSRFKARTERRMSTWFPELAPIAELVDDAVIDGEIILGNESVESFNTVGFHAQSWREGLSWQPAWLSAYCARAN
jgi:hypothetical protein